MSAFSNVSDPRLADLVDRWRTELTDQDLAVVERAGYGQAIIPGARPAVVFVDFQRAYVGEDLPILQQLDRWPSAGGAAAWNAMRNAQRLLDGARTSDVLSVFTRIGYPPDAATSNPFAAKRGGGAGFVLGTEGTELVIQRDAAEPLLTKTAASAFHGTKLAEILAERQIDTLIVCGLSTSGCVRATVVDAAARGLRVCVVADASADRVSLSHDVALFDIWFKYGTVISTDSAVELLRINRIRESRDEGDETGQPTSTSTQEIAP